MDKRDRDYSAEYEKWIASLPQGERDKLAAKGLDKALLPEEHGHGGQSAGNGISFSKPVRPEPDGYKLATLAENCSDIEIVCGVTPFDDLCDAEKERFNLKESEENKIKIEAISGLLSYLFAVKCGKEATPLDVTQRLYAICYTIRPALIENWSLQRIADIFGKTRAALSKEVLKLNEYGLKARTAKSAQAVSKYIENTTEWHAERKAAAKRAARLEYLRNYQAKRRAEKKAANAAYFEENKSRILGRQKENRSKARKSAK